MSRTLETLPYDILHYLFSSLGVRNLYQLMQVSKGLYDVVWKLQPTLSFVSTTSDEAFSKIISQCNPSYLRALDLSECPFLSIDTITQTLPKLTSLLTLNISSTKIKSIATIASLTQLKVLDISNCIYISRYGLEPFSNLTNLEHLNMYNLPRLRAESWKHLRNLKKLKHLVMAPNSDADVDHISVLTNLTSLNLHYMDKLTDDTLLMISEKLTNLKVLNLFRCKLFTDKGAKALGKLTKLESIILTSLRGVTDETVRNWRDLTGLTRLNFEDNMNITDDSMFIISSFTKLTYLSISGCDITDNGLSHLTHLPSLKQLYINNLRNPNVTDNAFTSITHLSNTLEVLQMCNIPNITDQAILTISSLTSLTSLRLFKCILLTDTATQHLLKLSQLTELNISACTGITGKGLETLKNLPNLRTLFSKQVGEVTEEDNQQINNN